MSHGSRAGRTAAAALLLLPACAALNPLSLEETIRAVDSAKSCCASMKQFAYEPLPPLESMWFAINVESPAFEFPTGKSYFKAFELPAYSGSYTITIKSYSGMHGPATAPPHSASVLVPVALLLDTDYAVTRVVDEVSFKRVDGSLLPLETLRLEATISVGPENSQERYIVISTARRALGGITVGTVPQIIPIFLPGVVTALPTGRREPRYMHHAPVGRLRIIVGESK